MAQSARFYNTPLRAVRKWFEPVAPQATADQVGTEIFARACPESVKIDETYRYHQEISRNSSLGSDGPPDGRIEVAVPYDGHTFFTRDAIADVALHLDRRAVEEPKAEALIGHLVLSNYQETNLPKLLDLTDRYGSIPLRVPVRSDVLDSAEELAADRHESRMEVDYAPPTGWPKLVPIRVQVALEDPDNSDLPRIDLQTDEGLRQIDSVAAKIAKHIGFRPNLLLRMRVELTLPPRRLDSPASPIVRRMALEWPTITSLAPSSLQLRVNHESAEMQHNPQNRSLEWFDVAMEPSGKHGDSENQSDSEKDGDSENQGDSEDQRDSEDPSDGDKPGDSDKGADSNVRRFVSPWMEMTVEKPGELLDQTFLNGEVEAEIPGELLSGMDARLFNARGRKESKNPLELSTRLIMKFTVVLPDVFARRKLSPYHSFHFDEVIPDELRVTDIATALKDQGFDVETPRLGAADDEQGHRWFLFAWRTEGPDEMQLWVFIKGDRYKTRRQSQLPGGHRYTSKFGSGDLRVFVRGQVPRDSRELTHEINALQQALRDRFRRVRVPR